VHREFSWDALSVTKDTECGGTKCYFPSSLQGERGDEGWLVGDSHVGSLTQWSRAWALAEELITHFGVNHLLRGRRVARSDSTPPDSCGWQRYQSHAGNKLPTFLAAG
jgi:hypothetical protein